MRIEQVWLTDFRNFEQVEAELPPGLTVVVGDNGQGKTNFLEALGYLARLESFRGVTRDALVRCGAQRAIVRARGDRAGRALLIEAEIVPGGRDRVLLNRQALRRARDLPGNLQVTVFAPDDLAMLKSGPSERRRYLDEVLGSFHPRHNATRSELERVLRQRSSLLRQAGGQLTPGIERTLEVWDAKLAEAGESLAHSRRKLLELLRPHVERLYGDLAGGPGDVALAYEQSWEGSLADALLAHRLEDVRRGTTSVGPHRDDLAITLAGQPARSHASQGEQRSLALALRLASHLVVEEEIGSAPLLLLDDVFSELDRRRSEALVEHLPEGQAVLTTASSPPPGMRPDKVLVVRDGRLEPRDGTESSRLRALP